MVECNLAKVDVAGSNPVSRSIFLFSDPSGFRGPLAQLVEQVTLNHKVAGSTPAEVTKLFHVKQLSIFRRGIIGLSHLRLFSMNHEEMS